MPDFKSQFLVNKDTGSATLNDGPEQADDDQEIDGADNKAPNRFSQLLTNHRDLGRTTDIHRLSSPMKRNRPRITNEVQSQDKDIARYLQKMQ